MPAVKVWFAVSVGSARIRDRFQAGKGRENSMISFNGYGEKATLVAEIAQGVKGWPRTEGRGAFFPSPLVISLIICATLEELLL
jgi:hypothetical protein